MRSFFLLIVACSCLFSCKTNTEQENAVSENLKFSLDTVLVDSGDEFIFLKDNLFLSALSPDKNYLINFNRFVAIAERINLDELKLEKTIRFEKEGPNGMNFISRFSITPEDNLMVWFYQFYAVFDQNSKKLKDLGLEKIAASVLGGSEVYPMMLFEDHTNPDRMLGVFIQWEDQSYFLLDFDLEEKSFKKTALPELDKLMNYSVAILFDGRSSGSYGVGVFSISAGDKIVIANNSINEVMVYDLKTDSLVVKNWVSPLLGSGKKYLPPKQVEQSTGQLEEIIKNIKEDIVLFTLNWDESQKRFFRFAARERFGEEKTENGEYIPIGADVYLSIFDENLNLLSESLVPELNSSPKMHFVKDGKIWIFENIEDELAFVRLSME